MLHGICLFPRIANFCAIFRTFLQILVGVSGFWRESISCVSFNFRVSLLTQLLTAYQLIHLLIN